MVVCPESLALLAALADSNLDSNTGRKRFVAIGGVGGQNIDGSM